MLVQEKRRERAAYKRKSDQKALLNGNSAFGYDEDAKEETKKKSCDCSGLNLNFSLFKNPLFTMYAFAFTFCMNGYGNNIILIPSHVKELGYNKTYVALSVTILGGCEVIARIFFGWFADLELIKRKNIFLISMFVSAIFAFIAPYFDSFIFMAIYAAIVGIFPGSFWSLISVLVIDVVGLENFTSAFGLISLCLALGASVSQPIIGELSSPTISSLFVHVYKLKKKLM
jgi:MFS family permease